MYEQIPIYDIPTLNYYYRYQQICIINIIVMLKKIVWHAHVKIYISNFEMRCANRFHHIIDYNIRVRIDRIAFMHAEGR